MPVIVDKDLGYSRIFKDIKSMDGKGVKVGIMGGTSAKGVSVIDYAVWNEFGTKHIPKRPFMQRTADESLAETLKFTEHLVGKMIDGGISSDLVLKNLGEFYVKKIKMTIRNAKEWAAANADSTIARKGSSSPLIDIGLMVNSVTYEVTSGVGGGSGEGKSSEGGISEMATALGKVGARFAGIR